MSAVPTMTEHQMVSSLSALFKVPAQRSIMDWFEAAGRLPGNLPFSWAVVRPLFERTAVLRNVLYPTGKNPLVEQLLEGPDDVLLVPDAYVSGREGLWFVRFLHDRSELTRWCSRQTRVGLACGQSRRGDALLAAPAYTFI